MNSDTLERTTPPQQGGRTVNIVYYTDPLCCWSWVLERELVQLEKEWQGAITWRYCMGGLLPDWKNFVDNQNSIIRPAQMGPMWMQASEQFGIELAHRIWVEDPPASSYPACVAVKCAGLQSAEAGKLFLHLVRKAVMVHGLNIAKPDVLQDVASSVGTMVSDFSVEQFMQDLQNDRGIEAFRKDLQETKYRNINRFPTLLIERPGARSMLVTGFRPAHVLLHIIDKA